MVMHAAADRVREDSWAVVLAGGGGLRLRGCTVDQSGHHVPKQYCAIDRHHTLLQLAIDRARHLVDPSHVLVVVQKEHKEWWEPQLEGSLPRQNVLAQPLDRGTAVGVLLPLLHVLARDPEAHLVFLPADHHFRDEERLAKAMRRALEYTFREPAALVFVGIEPDSPTSDFGYLVPQKAAGVGPKPIVSFVEKPARDLARRLIRQGALWNTLIFAARARCVLKLIRERFPKAADALRGAMVLAEDPTFPTRALRVLYPRLDTINLSRDVLERSDYPMAVTSARGVGWSELGTPERIAVFCDEMHFGDPSRPHELHPPWEPSEPALHGEPDVEPARTTPHRGG